MGGARAEPSDCVGASFKRVKIRFFRGIGGLEAYHILLTVIVTVLSHR